MNCNENAAPKNCKPYPLDPRYIPNIEVGLIWTTIRKKYLKGIPTNDGYLRVKIKRKFRYVHRIIAETNLQNPDNKPMVHHKNNVVNDNRLENLMYVTEQENSDFKFQFGTVTRRRIVNIPPGSKFTGFHYNDKIYPTLTELATDAGVANSTASTWFMQGKINYTIDGIVQTEVTLRDPLRTTKKFSAKDRKPEASKKMKELSKNTAEK